MKQRPKEILKNKADKMIDLIIDDIETGGVKNLTAGFTKNNLKYQIKVEIIVADKDTPQTTTTEEPLGESDDS